MDAIHDLGGKMGYEPIAANEKEEAFHATWEGRAYALCQLSDASDWTIDWWRHVRECSPPHEYLTTPYFASWIMTQAVALIDSGIISIDEVTSGKPTAQRVPPPAVTSAEVVANNRNLDHSFALPAKSTPRFSPGDRVTTVKHGAAGHTRLPAYARGFSGTIHAHHGAHAFPDAGALGQERGEHLYTVAFKHTDLFPQANNSNDVIYLDLWEPYFD